jgi:hypothetical protein
MHSWRKGEVLATSSAKLGLKITVTSHTNVMMGEDGRYVFVDTCITSTNPAVLQIHYAIM